MFYSVQSGGIPAFNYMVPGPHPYIMGDSYLAPMHSDLVEGAPLYQAYGADLTLDDMAKLSSDYSPIRSGPELSSFMHAVYTHASEERAMKGMDSIPYWRTQELQALAEQSEIATDTEHYTAALDQLADWTRDIEAPMTRNSVRSVKSATRNAPPLDAEGNPEQEEEESTLPFGLKMEDFQDKRIWIGSALVLGTIWAISRRLK